MKTILRGAVSILASFLVIYTAWSAPTRITSLAATQITGTTISVAWTAPTPGTGSLMANDVRISTGPINNLNWTSATRLTWLDNVPGTQGTLQTATLTGLTAGSSYYVAMKVQDTSGGWSTISDLVVGNTLSTTNPYVTLAWHQSPDPNVVGYHIYIGSASLTYTNSIDVGNVTEATITNIVNGATYYMSATAYNILGVESDYSNEITYTVPADP